MHRELEIAFRRTVYRALAPTGELILRTDQPDPALAELLKVAGVQCAAVLTAFNPGGIRSPPFRNRHAHRLLRAELMRAGCELLAGRNEDPRRRWPVEPTWIALGLPCATALAIAARYGQAAILWTGTSGTPRLIEVAACANPKL